MDDGELFFMTYARSRPNELVPWIEMWDVPLLTNAMHRWSFNTDRFLHMWEYDTPHVIDAGGYNVQAKFVDRNGNIEVPMTDVWDELGSEYPFYPFTLAEYHEWLEAHSHEFEWGCVMDYACEERFDDLWTVEDRVRATLDNTIEHFDLDPSYDVLPVLQGRSVEDYVRSYDYLKDHGIPVDYVGLGTICRLSSESMIVDVERKVREQTNVESIHGFGVKVDAYKLGAEFETADSQAWVYNASNGKKNVLEWNGTGYEMNVVEQPDDSLERTVQSFKTYYAYVTWLKHGQSAVPVNEVLGHRAMDGVRTSA